MIEFEVKKRKSGALPVTTSKVQTEKRIGFDDTEQARQFQIDVMHDVAA